MLNFKQKGQDISPALLGLYQIEIQIKSESRLLVKLQAMQFDHQCVA